MNWVYALGVGAAAFSLCARLARPEGTPGALPFVFGDGRPRGSEWRASVRDVWLAGAAAAALYALHCNENAAAFVVSWYTIGILLPGLVGTLIGPRVLHW
jgi:hypothetical protein